MSDVILHGVLNMPLHDDPAECDLLTWVQFKDRARQASARIEQLEANLSKALGALELLHNDLVHAWPSVVDLGPVANARTTLAELKGQDDE